MALTAPITVGTASANACHAADLGKLILLDGKMYRVCKNTATLALAAGRGLVTARSSGVATWNVALSTNTSGTTEDLVFVPDGQVGSTGTTSLIASDYFLALVSGETVFISANTTLVYVAGQVLVVNTLGGVSALAAVTTASTVTYPQACLRATNTVATTNTVAAGEITGTVSGLV